MQTYQYEGTLYYVKFYYHFFVQKGTSFSHLHYTLKQEIHVDTYLYASQFLGRNVFSAIVKGWKKLKLLLLIIC